MASDATPEAVPMKGSQTLRLIAQLLETSPAIEEDLEELKEIVKITEVRNATLLEEKENTIIGLQSTSFRHQRSLNRLETELANAKERIYRHQAGTFAAVQRTEHLSQLLAEKTDTLEKELKLKEETKMKTQENVARLDFQIRSSNTEATRIRAQLQASQNSFETMKQEKCDSEKREELLADIAASLRSKNSKLESQVAASPGHSAANEGPTLLGSRKRSYPERGESSSVNKKGNHGPPIKGEYEEMMPKIKVKHWAPDGYYHCKEVS